MVTIVQPQHEWPPGRKKRWNEFNDLLGKADSLTGQSVLVQASNNPEFNYWFVKVVLKTKGLPQEDKVSIAMPHVKIVFEYEDAKIAEKLAAFLRYKPAWQETLCNREKIKTKKMLPISSECSSQLNREVLANYTLY